MCPGTDTLLSGQKPLIKQKAELNAFLILSLRTLQKFAELLTYMSVF